MVHEASVSGNLEAIAHKEYRQSVYIARDTNGISAFHKVQYRVTLVVKYLGWVDGDVVRGTE